jgi:uncharacterized protein
MSEESGKSKPRNLNLSIDLRIVVISLIIIILGMLMSWRPWNGLNSNDRTISVTGNATLKAVPDEYVFYPAYSFTNADKAAALAEMTKKSDEVVAKLKELGVADEKIKTNSNGYDKPVYYAEPVTEDLTYTLQIVVTINDKDLAQKIQDYLLTTVPTGSVSPQPTFSETKRKELQDKARDEATKDARKKADQSADNLGFRVGEIKSISDGAGFDQPMPMDTMSYGGSLEVSASSRMAIQPGESELSYSVSVVYYIK